MINILVVEDTTEYRSVAQQAIEGLPDRYRVSFVPNLYQATDAIKRDKAGRIDGIICDLFMPSGDLTIIGGNGQRLIELIERRRQDEDFPFGAQCHASFAQTGEPLAPVGLQLLPVTYLNDRRAIPLVFFSQGDRHEGAFGLVRYVLFEHVGLHYLSLFVRAGERCDKFDPAQWQEAVAMLRPERQLAIWRKMLARSVFPGREVEDALTLYGEDQDVLQ